MLYLVHLCQNKSGLGANAQTLRVEAAAFKVLNSDSKGIFCTLTVEFVDDQGFPVAVYNGVKAVEKSQVLAG